MINQDYETTFKVYEKDKSSLSQAYTESTMFKHTLHAAICSKCFNIKGRVNYRAFQTVFVETENLTDFTEKEIKTQIMKTAPDLWESKLECLRCKRITNHFWVDDLIAQLIQTLNISGYKTIYSCAGHNDGYKMTSFNYILIDGHRADEFVEKFDDLDSWSVLNTTMEMKNGRLKDVTRLFIDNEVPAVKYEEEINKLITKLKEI